MSDIAGPAGPAGETGEIGPKGERGEAGPTGPSHSDSMDYVQAVHALSAPNIRTAQYTRRTRAWLWPIGLAVIVALAGVAISLISLAHEADDRAQVRALVQQVAAEAHQGRVSQCDTGNTFRATDLKRWTEIFAYATPPKGSTPAQVAAERKASEALKKILIAPDTPIDCSKMP